MIKIIKELPNLLCYYILTDTLQDRSKQYPQDVKWTINCEPVHIVETSEDQLRYMQKQQLIKIELFINFHFY